MRFLGRLSIGFVAFALATAPFWVGTALRGPEFGFQAMCWIIIGGLFIWSLELIGRLIEEVTSDRHREKYRK